MCRLFIANQKAIRAYDKKHNIGILLKHLEKECGGHGNGVALIKNGRVMEYVKGIDTTTDEIERILMKDSYDYAIFHTRIASVGAIMDERCHPFIHGDDVLAMNGTVKSLSRTAQAVGVTDTEIAFDLVKGRPLSYVVDVLRTLGSVFVGVADGGKPYAIRNGGGALQEWLGRAGGFMFASSFPDSTSDVVRLPFDFVFADGVRSSGTKTTGNNEATLFLRSAARTRFFDTEDDFRDYYGYGIPKGGLTPFLRGVEGGEYDDDNGRYGEDEIEDRIADAFDEGYADGYKDGFTEGSYALSVESY